MPTDLLAALLAAIGLDLLTLTPDEIEGYYLAIDAGIPLAIA